MTLGNVKDGTSNTFAAGEVIGRCENSQAGDWGWWDSVAVGGAFGHTSTPLNILTTCVSTENEAIKRQYIYPACAVATSGEQKNLSWAFRCFHPAGANFAMCDGSAQFINNDFN